MTQFLIALSIALHGLATVVFLGYFVVLALIYLPALQSEPQAACGAIIAAVSKRSRPWLYGSLLLIAATGVYLTFADPNYMGIGNFSSPWAIAMLVKHLIILAMLGMGFWYNAILRVGPLASSNTGAAQAIARFRTYVKSMAASGVALLVLTALAQAQP